MSVFKPAKFRHCQPLDALQELLDNLSAIPNFAGIRHADLTATWEVVLFGSMHQASPFSTFSTLPTPRVCTSITFHRHSYRRGVLVNTKLVDLNLHVTSLARRGTANNRSYKEHYSMRTMTYVQAQLFVDVHHLFLSQPLTLSPGNSCEK